MMFAASTTRPVSAGKGGSAASAGARLNSIGMASARTINATTFNATTFTRPSELDLGRFLGALARGELGHRQRGAVEERSPDHRREDAQRRVELAHRLDIVAPRHRDAGL